MGYVANLCEAEREARADQDDATIREEIRAAAHRVIRSDPDVTLERCIDETDYEVAYLGETEHGLVREEATDVWHNTRCVWDDAGVDCEAGGERLPECGGRQLCARHAAAFGRMHREAA